MINVMKKMILGLLFIATACIIVQSADVLPQGKWVVTQITSEKNTNGKVQTTDYISTARIISHIPCPQELDAKKSAQISEKRVITFKKN